MLTIYVDYRTNHFLGIVKYLFKLIRNILQVIITKEKILRTNEKNIFWITFYWIFCNR
jgi:hypothetical protein